MKKLIAIFLTLVMVISIVPCQAATTANKDDSKADLNAAIDAICYPKSLYGFVSRFAIVAEAAFEAAGYNDIAIPKASEYSFNKYNQYVYSDDKTGFSIGIYTDVKDDPESDVMLAEIVFDKQYQSMSEDDRQLFTILSVALLNGVDDSLSGESAVVLLYMLLSTKATKLGDTSFHEYAYGKNKLSFYESANECSIGFLVEQ